MWLTRNLNESWSTNINLDYIIAEAMTLQVITIPVYYIAVNISCGTKCVNHNS